MSGEGRGGGEEVRHGAAARARNERKNNTRTSINRLEEHGGIPLQQLKLLSFREGGKVPRDLVHDNPIILQVEVHGAQLRGDLLHQLGVFELPLEGLRVRSSFVLGRPLFLEFLFLFLTLALGHTGLKILMIVWVGGQSGQCW